jgi:hypothetical protein
MPKFTLRLCQHQYNPQHGRVLTLTLRALQSSLQASSFRINAFLAFDIGSSGTAERSP